MDSFLDYLRFERNYSEKTVGAYEADLVQFQQYMEEVAGEWNPLCTESEDVRSWMIQLMDEGLAATSVNRKLSALRSFYKYLLKKGAVQADPLQKINGPKKKKKLPVFVKDSEMEELLDGDRFEEGFAGCRDHAIIETFYQTGIRLSELIGLNNGDVDLDSRNLKVTGKRNKQRIIPFGERLEEELRKYADCKAREVPAGSEAFFVRPTGQRLTPNMVQRIVKQRLTGVVTLKKKSPHVLRHTFATTMLNHDAELGAIKELLGHESLATTEIYTHTTFEELRKVYKQAHPRA